MSDVGTGTTIVFGTTAFTAELLSVNGNDIERPVIQTSHMGTTGYHTKMPGDLVDPGNVEMEFAFDPDDQPPVGQPAETITITFPVPSGMSSGATLVSSGFIRSWNWGAVLEEKMTGTAVVEWSGTPVWTDAA